MSIALFIDPTSEEFAHALEVASFVAEAAVDGNEQLILSCSPSAALEIGISAFGRGSARTVEGGERRASPVVLLPLIHDPDDPVDARLHPAPEEGAGTLADLVDLGIVAAPEERDDDPFGRSDPIEAFVRAVARRRISTVVGIGSRPRFWAPVLNQVREVPEGRLFLVPEFAPPDLPSSEDRIVRIHRAEIPARRPRVEGDGPPLEDEFEQFIVGARQQAALVAALIGSLLRA
jgi:hypothetical protein